MLFLRTAFDDEVNRTGNRYTDAGSFGFDDRVKYTDAESTNELSVETFDYERSIRIEFTGVAALRISGIISEIVLFIAYNFDRAVWSQNVVRIGVCVVSLKLVASGQGMDSSRSDSVDGKEEEGYRRGGVVYAVCCAGFPRPEQVSLVATPPLVTSNSTPSTRCKAR